MPYIDKDARPKYHDAIKDLVNEVETSGELNHVITKLCHGVLTKNGNRYQYYNAIVGVLECVKLEFYRRRLAEYENDKIKEHGDLE